MHVLHDIFKKISHYSTKFLLCDAMFCEVTVKATAQSTLHTSLKG